MSKTLPAPLTRNITRVFREASPAQVAAGLEWYADAHRIASAFAVKYGVTLEVAAGVIAALSPNNSWGANVNLAGRFLATPGGLTSGYFSVGLAKARAILTAAPEDIPAILNGPKTRAFYAGIVTNGATDVVCVDRHAHSLAINMRLTKDAGMGTKRYATIADMYVRAARILSRELEIDLSAAQVQAITWGVWRSKFWSEGAFDIK